MTTTQVFTPYNEALAKLKDKHVISPSELEKDREFRSEQATISDIVDRARESLRLASSGGHRIALLDVKVCFSACAEHLELRPPDVPDSGPSLRAKNLVHAIMMCEVYNALCDSLRPADHAILLVLMGYEGYRSTDARHVQDSDDTMWLADTSPEQIPYVLWVCQGYENDRLDYRIPTIGSSKEQILAYSFASHCNYVRILLQLESNAVAALGHLGPCYETMHVTAKLRWLLHRAKGELVMAMPLAYATAMMSAVSDDFVKEEFKFSSPRDWDAFSTVLEGISNAEKEDLITFVQKVYARNGTAEDTEQELLWQAMTYRIFKMMQAENSKVKHVNIYDRHNLQTGHELLDGDKDWLEEEDEVDRLFMKALEAEDEEQLAPMPFIDSEIVVSEHYALSMKGCKQIKRDRARLKARKTWVLPERIAKEIKVTERGTKKSKALLFVDSRTVVECDHKILHRLQRRIAGLRGVVVAGVGVHYDLSQLTNICDTDINNVVNRIVSGALGYEAFVFLANLILRGCLLVSKASTTACFVPERNKRDDGVCITSFLSRSVMSAATYGHIDGKLCWLPGEGLNPMVVSEDRRNRMTFLTEYSYSGSLKCDIGGVDLVYKLSSKSDVPER